ncbi:hypothetical protein ACFSR7_21700 [Cohnella sp. GCM10020058]|uniref:hypothetical protein n=1 Tax=Cohnella sp. GCM10020058 TaxID=3317330 RepID=UPI00362E64AC
MLVKKPPGEFRPGGSFDFVGYPKRDYRAERRSLAHPASLAIGRPIGAPFFAQCLQSRLIQRAFLLLAYRHRADLCVIPANIHLFSPILARLSRKDANLHPFSSTSPFSGVCFEFTCIFAGIASSSLGRQKIHVQMQVIGASKAADILRRPHWHMQLLYA